MPGAFGQVDLFIPGAHSLKDRRNILRSLEQKLQAMNISVTDASERTVWQTVRLQFAIAAASPGEVDRRLESLKLQLQRFEGEVEVTSFYFKYVELED